MLGGFHTDLSGDMRTEHPNLHAPLLNRRRANVRAERRFLVAWEGTVADFKQDSGMPQGAAMVTGAGSGHGDVTVYPAQRPWPIRSPASESAQYHGQENQRRSSVSGARTAARTAAAIRSRSAAAGSSPVPPQPRQA